MSRTLELLSRARAGERAALARLITMLESDPDLALDHDAPPPPRSASSAHVIGFTGSPGAGKSSLVDRLAAAFAAAGARPAVLGVDPTSPFTGGAVLGDRVRISEATVAAGVFVRSMASRGQAGGLARAVSAAVRLLAECGHSPVLVETVGAGQGEIAVRELADTVVVTLVPGMGDDVQMLKMGILEIADVYAVNKADLGGADAYATHLREALAGARHPSGWEPPIVATSARTGQGVRELTAAIDSHRSFLAADCKGDELRAERTSRRILRALAERLAEQAACEGECRTELRRLAAAVSSGEMSEWHAAGMLMGATPFAAGKARKQKPAKARSRKN